MCPRQGSPFSLLRQRKGTKRKATRRWRSACGRLLCGARVLGPRAQLALFAALTPLRQTSRSQLLMRANARGPKALRSSTPPTGTRTPDSARFASHNDASLRSRPMRSEVWTGKVAKQRPHCFWAPWEASRSAGVWGRARQRASSTDFARLSERSGRRPRSEFGARPQTPSTAEQSGPSRTASVGSPFFCLLFFGEAKNK